VGKKHCLTYIVLILIGITTIKGQVLEKKVKMKAKSQHIEMILDEISRQTGIYFSYSSSIKVLDKKYTPSGDSMLVKDLLDNIFHDKGVKYMVWSNQVILKEEVIHPVKKTIRGKILSAHSGNPVEYASLQVMGSSRGTIADEQGNFVMEIPTGSKEDMMKIQALGFQAVSYKLDYLTKFSKHTIYLQPDTFSIPQVEINAPVTRSIEMGNKFSLFKNSMYMDTHGQQTALYISNEDKLTGKIKNVNYYLSREGNTNAPFRIRVYALDTVTGGPGIDLLPEILVVKPNEGKGWFSINLSRYNIRFPADGVFIGMEGVFPDEYQFFYTGNEFVELSELEEEVMEENSYIHDNLNYGQQLGFNHRGENNTWHYSLSRTWFQLPKNNFNVLISADIIVYQEKSNFFDFLNFKNK